MKGTTSKVIEVIVAADGSTRIETRGFSGAQCQQASRFLETALGRRVDETLTPEFYQSANTEDQISQSN